MGAPQVRARTPRLGERIAAALARPAVRLRAVSGELRALPRTVRAHPVSSRVLRAGMTGADVRALNQRLFTLHFLPGPERSEYTTATVDGVIAFQSGRASPATAAPGPDPEGACARGGTDAAAATAGQARRGVNLKAACARSVGRKSPVGAAGVHGDAGVRNAARPIPRVLKVRGVLVKPVQGMAALRQLLRRWTGAARTFVRPAISSEPRLHPGALRSPRSSTRSTRSARKLTCSRNGLAPAQHARARGEPLPTWIRPDGASQGFTT